MAIPGYYNLRIHNAAVNCLEVLFWGIKHVQILSLYGRLIDWIDGLGDVRLHPYNQAGWLSFFQIKTHPAFKTSCLNNNNSSLSKSPGMLHVPAGTALRMNFASLFSWKYTKL